jgi:hypothetical protein
MISYLFLLENKFTHYLRKQKKIIKKYKDIQIYINSM